MKKMTMKKYLNLVGFLLATCYQPLCIHNLNFYKRKKVQIFFNTVFENSGNKVEMKLFTLFPNLIIYDYYEI